MSRVTPAVALAVFARDQRCFLAKIEPDHRCRDVWGRPHASTDLARLTLEHVKDGPRMAKRAPSDPAHLVALCGYANVAVPSRSQREAMRAYLKAVTT